MWQTPDQVVKSIFSGVRQGKVILIPGRINRLIVNWIPKGLRRRVNSKSVKRNIQKRKVIFLNNLQQYIY